MNRTELNLSQRTSSLAAMPAVEKCAVTHAASVALGVPGGTREYWVNG
jgi:hypothetical protein